VSISGRLVNGMTGLAGEVTEAVTTLPAAVKTFSRNGLLSPVRPDRLVGMGLAVRKWGMSPASLVAVNAARDPSLIGVIDERESVTYAELDRRSTIVAAALRDQGVREGDAVALLARNSAAFVVGQSAIGKLGADVLYANTGFAGPQLGDVLTSEKAAAIVADEEFAGIVDDVAGDLPFVIAWHDDEDDPPKTSIAGLVAAAGDELPKLPRPSRAGKHVILTSGTTGKPKGASRGAPSLLTGMTELVALLEAMPLPARGVTVLAAPMFHAWGMAHVTVGLGLGSTLVVRRKFDPAATMKLVAEHRADVLIAVPVMIQRIMAVEETVDTPSLKLVGLSGSALPPSVAEKFMDRYGDVIYSLYGSTEVAYVSVASPRDIREAPGTAGRVLRGVTLRLVDDDDNDVPPGETGRIFAGNPMAFEGYTSGEDKARLGPLTATGDVGRFDEQGRLFVEGRDDDMIVSGGENVFPAEVEECLHQHPAVADCVVVGVEDDDFGQVLVAHVVLGDGGSATEDDLRKHVKSQLAGYKVPRKVVLHDELPRNETGKVLKRELQQD
jgi:fatty-acyl-CoA synthase